MNSNYDIEQKIREFKDTVRAPEYNSVIENLMRKAYENNIQVYLWSQGYSSAKDQEPDGICIVRIDNNPDSGNMNEIIFNLMHELGHCYDPNKLPLADKNNIILRRGREVRAWQIADHEFNSHPELMAAAQEYTDFKGKCLATYMKDE